MVVMMVAAAIAYNDGSGECDGGHGGDDSDNAQWLAAKVVVTVMGRDDGGMEYESRSGARRRRR
jgi:hypothetical protein